MGDQIDELLQSRIDAGDFPSVSYLVAEKGEVVLRGALGFAVIDPERIAAQTDTIYDLASLTKPLVTGLMAAMLIESGSIAPDYRVATILNEFDVDGKRTIKIFDLSTHTSHLPAWEPLYLRVNDRSEVVGEIAKIDLEIGREAVIYSDLNFITLAAIVERFGGATLDKLAAERVFVPLGLKDTYFNPPRGIRGRIAASEKGNVYERSTCVEQGYPTEPAAVVDGYGPFRAATIWGEVHDNNAHFMGGVAGHAGLFSTAEEVFRMAQQFLPDHTRILSRETCDLFSTNFTRGLNEDRSFGFQLASTAGSTAGEKMPSQSFGHTGFAGTSLWIDPAHDRVFILLTNRTHNRSLPFANINPVRRRFHDLAIEMLDGNL